MKVGSGVSGKRWREGPRPARHQQTLPGFAEGSRGQCRLAPARVHSKEPEYTRQTPHQEHAQLLQKMLSGTQKKPRLDPGSRQCRAAAARTSVCGLFRPRGRELDAHVQVPWRKLPGSSSFTLYNQVASDLWGFCLGKKKVFPHGNPGTLGQDTGRLRKGRPKRGWAQLVGGEKWTSPSLSSAFVF